MSDDESKRAESPGSVSEPIESPPSNAGEPPASPSPAPPTPETTPFEDLESDDRGKVVRGLGRLIESILVRHPSIRDYTLLAIFDEKTSIESFELDRIYSGLKARNMDQPRDVLLLLLSSGGQIEPAYQISKLCKSYARSKFVVCVPRYAKSAATLIALGADQVHMGELGHLGPIDPQIGGLPALAVARALDTLAELVERHPESSLMLAQYLKDKLQVQQIGYYERVAESAVQYGQRLLSKKNPSHLAAPPAQLASTLVHDYKDHGFVIDYEEATQILGSDWILQGTAEAAFADEFYSMFDLAGFIVGRRRGERRKLALIGSLHPDELEASVLLMKQ